MGMDEKEYKKVHIVPSAFNKTFCGLDSSSVISSSLGIECTCSICLQQAQYIIDRTDGGKGDLSYKK